MRRVTLNSKDNKEEETKLSEEALTQIETI